MGRSLTLACCYFLIGALWVRVRAPSVPNAMHEQSPADVVTQPHFKCPSNARCESLGAECLLLPRCNWTCTYGESVVMPVSVLDLVPCVGERNHSRTATCRYCYQTDIHEHTCSAAVSCRSTTRRESYVADCTVNSNVLCLGKRTFKKKRFCQLTTQYSWTVTMLLSVTLGGFGVDRFYLGHWKEGLGKLFSFGGLGIWTLIDMILIAIGYITPSDGSFYT